MGFLSSLGNALKNPDLWDSLDAASMAINGNDAGAQAMRDRIEQRRFADEIAREMEARRQQGDAPPEMSPSRPLPPPQALAPDAPAQLPTRAAPISVSELAPAAPRPVDVTTPAPAPIATRSLYADLLPKLMRASGRGIDTAGLTNTLMREDYINSLPMKDQAAARMDPARFMGWQHDDNKPVYNETTPGNTWGRYDPATKTYDPIYTAPNRPEPVTTERVVGAIVAKAARGETLTEAEQGVYNRWKDGTSGSEPKPPGTSQIVASVLDKVRTGGVESLNPGEKAIWDRYNRDDASGLAALLGRGGGGDEGDDQEQAAPPAPAKPPPGGRKLPQKAAPAQKQTPQQSGQPPAPVLASIPEGGQVTFANGQVWSKKGGRPVFVGMAK